MFGLSERGRAEVALREVEQRYRTLVDSAHDAIFTVDASGTITSLNPAFERMTGWDRAEWVGRSFTPLIHPDDLASVTDAFGQAIQGNLLPHYEVRVATRSGEFIVVEVTSSPLHDDGTIAGFLGVARDVTRRKQAEEELQRRGRILEAMAFASERFLAGSTKDVDEVLARLGMAAEADSIAIFQNVLSEDGDLLTTPRHTWTTHDLESFNGRVSAELQGLGYHASGLDRWVEVLSAGGAIIGHLRDFPLAEQRFLAPWGVRSLVVVPIFVAEEWWGTVGFAQIKEERTWSITEVGALRTAAGILGATIQQDRAAQALREAEDQYRRLVELSPDAILVLRNAVIEFANRAAARLVGSGSSDDLVGASVLTYVHPDSRAQVVALLQDLREARSAAPVAQRFMRLDGSPIEVEVAATAFHYEGEAAVQMVARDATDRLRAEEALRASEERYRNLYTELQHELSERRRIEEQLRQAEAKFRTLVERIPAITYTAQFGAQGKWFYVSPQIEGILGFTPEEWLASPDRWFSQVFPEDRARVMEMEERSRRTGEPMQCEYRLTARDGRVVWVRDDWVVDPTESGEPVLQGVMFDITERKQAEEQIRQAEAKYRTLVEQIPAISYVDVFDPAYAPDMFRTAYVSPQIETMLGYKPEEFIESPELWYSLVHPDDREQARASDEHHYRTGEPLTREYRVIARNGRIVWVLDEAVLYRDEQGGPRFSQGILYDITARKKAEEDLERALSIEREAAERLRALDEMKNTFLHAVSHELRTPLSAVLGLALTLEREEVQLSAEEGQDMVRRLSANARKLDQLLSDLLDLDRLDRGIMEPRRRPTDVAALVRRTVENSDILGTRPVRVAAQLVVVSVDAPKVERIVENLLANAARHTPPGTTIWVRVAPQQGGVLLSVEDDGPGISESVKETIFEPFRQGPGVPSHSPGVGIGLSLVAKFAELHGGRAWVDERPGGGASFKVFLPGAAA